MKNQTLRGVTLLFFSSVAFAAMTGLVRYASTVNSYQVVFIRFAVGIALLGSAALSGRAPLHFVSKKTLFFRGLVGGVSIFFFYLSIQHVGITKGVVINYTHPVFATLIGIRLLKEKVGKLKWAAIAGCLAGVILLTSNPGGWSAGMGGYDLLAVAGAILSGVAVVLVKKARETDSSAAIYFSQCLVGFWIMLFPASAVSGDLGLTMGALLIAAGFLATAGQLLMSQAYGYVSVSTGSLTTMLVPVLSGFIGFFVFHETLSATALAGACLVFVYRAGRWFIWRAGRKAAASFATLKEKAFEGFIWI